MSMPDCFTSSTTFPKLKEQYTVENLPQKNLHSQIHNDTQVLSLLFVLTRI